MISVEAPSNIALIKYMGKVSGGVNMATNPSLSFTLDHLKTRVELRETQTQNDQWAPLQQSGWIQPELSEKGEARFLKHFQFLKEQLGLSGNFEIRSASNFPSDCGLASSASSFAALTMAAGALALEQKKERKTLFELADLSRQGSGSSGRSFFGPWCLWDQNGIQKVELPFADLRHGISIVEDRKKAVSSSEAHKRVTSSLLFQGRGERVQSRMQTLLAAMKHKNWNDIFEIVWAEFWDMHALFETAQPSFGYMTHQSLSVLQAVREFWAQHKDGPVVTMDAGANVHFLWRANQESLHKEWKERHNSIFPYQESSEFHA